MWGGIINDEQYSSIVLTSCVFPHEVGPLTLAVNGCLKTNVSMP